MGEQAIYLAQLKGLSKADATTRLKMWFEKFGIMPWWNKKLEELSKGMQQKVQFIITVLHEPPLLIFDEPFSGFDPVNAEMLKREILALRDKGHTIIFSTHNMSSVEEVCDEIALINHSQVVLSGHVVEGQFNVINHTHSGDLHTYTLQKAEQLTNSQLISAVANNIELRSISEQMPSMQEIFLKTVQQTNDHE